MPRPRGDEKLVHVRASASSIRFRRLSADLGADRRRRLRRLEPKGLGSPALQAGDVAVVVAGDRRGAPARPSVNGGQALMRTYKLVYLGGAVEYLLAESLESAQAYARAHFARLEL